jgi:PAS domain S-box-containing protein
VIDNMHLMQVKAPPQDKDSLIPWSFFNDALYTNNIDYVKGRWDLLLALIKRQPSALENLKRSESRFRAIYENSYDSILLADLDGNLVSANKAAQELFQMTQAELKKTGRQGLLLMDEAAKQAIEERSRSGHARAELLYKRKDGSIFVGETTSNVFVDLERTPKTSIIIRDISKQKRLQNTLAENEGHYQTMFEKSNLALMIVEVIPDSLGKIIDSRIVRVNEAYERFVGIAAEKLVGKLSSEVFPKADSVWIEMIDHSFQSGERSRLEFFGYVAKQNFEALCFPYSNNRVCILFANFCEVRSFKLLGFRFALSGQ